MMYPMSPHVPAAVLVRRRRCHPWQHRRHQAGTQQSDHEALLHGIPLPHTRHRMSRVGFASGSTRSRRPGFGPCVEASRSSEYAPVSSGKPLSFPTGGYRNGLRRAGPGSARPTGPSRPHRATRRGPPSRPGRTHRCRSADVLPHAEGSQGLERWTTKPRPFQFRLARGDRWVGSPDWRQTRDRGLCPTTGRQEPNPGTTPDSALHTPDRCSGTSAAS